MTGSGRRLLPLLFAGAIRVSGLNAAEPVDLEEVYCALCHYEEGDDFAAGVHYRPGLLLCHDCHGGLPYEPDEAIAKAPETGFIGKPSRQQITEVCGDCHRGPAEFLALGPHADPAIPDNATCISCHSNHNVHSADLSLMDDTCHACHAGGSTAVTVGAQIRQLLESKKQHGEQVRSEWDSLSAGDPRLRRQEMRVAAAFASLRQADAMTHSWNPELIAEQVAEFDEDLGLVEDGIKQHVEDRRLRPRLVVGIWLFILLNLVLVQRHRRNLSQ